MRQVKIRAAVLGDAQILSVLAGSNKYSAHWRAADFEAEISNNFSRLYIALSGDEIIAGFIAFRFCCGAGELTNFAVLPEYCRGGIGGALLAEGIKTAEGENIDNITLEVNENNFPAIALYKKFLFETVNIRKNFYNDNQDALLMLRKL